MILTLKKWSAVALCLGSVSAFASPTHLTTHNNTDLESNAFVAGTVPSPYPTGAHTTRQVYWNMVRLACFGHTTNGKCPAVIRMATNTAHPFDVGTVSMDLESGDISPKTITGNGYTLTVNGPGEATLTKN
ncbi:MAG: hypothetical protein Q8M40_13085 [Legionella sp.]|nr:hypothetical protein [Legionella sp.]HRD70202.1 hypothetical protein [Legionella sp.]